MIQATQAAMPEDPQPYPGWPGPCAYFGCEGPHPCPLFHDSMNCGRAPIKGCSCDIEAVLTAQLQDVDDEGQGEDLGPEPEWCSHPDCHDRAHGDGMHLDEDGRPFRGSPEPVFEPEQPIYDEDDLENPVEVDAPAPQPAPRPFPLHPIYDQLVAEQTYPELTP